ncbi:hypothetical protein F0562_025146 [Nyssa sinensis]|uniref:Protein kinase domain-containing protein n=1 Tax=Nyssa sinensis TaxID=561372 RepID=A0A5J5BHI3_9ASTE|nr:hypothetical protein F0562_025146 [Nyssa sinensis]
MSRRMGFLSGLCGCLEKRGRSAGSSGGGGGKEEDDGGELWNFFFELRDLQIATNYFSELNRLGSTRFSVLYKGLMPNGQVVAVEKVSDQGLKKFINEVKLLLKVQHKNLATLLGCCAEGPEIMLVYEYLPNGPLDYILFEKKKFASLDWTKRFRIVTGVARGLLYLHEEAPLTIIHGGIRPRNILLDEQLNPKIADFGMARLAKMTDIDSDELDILGPYGYLSPEYVMYGNLSVKTDVFSFGVLVLEIVSGRKIHGMQLGEEKAYPLSYAWMLFEEGRSLDLVDPSLDDCDFDEAAMCIQLGLSCCQYSPTERPNMSSVHLMLSTGSFTLPTPRNPASLVGGQSWTSTHSRNSISDSSIDGGR